MVSPQLSKGIKAVTVIGAGAYSVNWLVRQHQEKHLSPAPLTNMATPSPPKNDAPYDHRPFTLLTQTDIDTRLRSGQSISKLDHAQHQVKGVKAIYSNQLPSNDPVEDNYSIHTFQNGLIAGVYDGHIGPQCSRLIKKQLPIYMARELSATLSSTPAGNKESAHSTEETAISTAFDNLDQDIQQRFYDLFPRNVKYATENDIRSAIARQPDRAKTEAIITEAIHGSCACTVYIKEGYVYAANTGDSRVVIVSQDEDGSWKGRRLVEEESPANPEWKAHMLSQHPSDESDVLVMRKRIFGLIAVGGSFGDIMYKVPVEYQMKVLPFIPYDIYKTFARYHHRIVVNYKTPPYLRSTPLIAKHKLTNNDKFIILGTDGLWDELSWDDVRSTEGDQVAAHIMSRWQTSSPTTEKEPNPATHMLREALLYEAVYKNVGQRRKVEDSTLELSKRLTRKPSRRYRDDITITVIELGNEEVSASSEDVGPARHVEEVDVSEPRLVNPKSSKSSWLLGWIGSRL
ncbi:phosphatase 2C-like domain-containing protein [Mycotypha africana]|uniref:phosphatase 2C-like domain-containing protein n=1 Tax=Mycotypha africana TaxID=64632 RepID=UPI00230164B9|nr:phosphatase 2C-like domain-containing protein [Mycotypha africana]KAI8979803.1 phosphatase 2C-like domain-containing protein [Mycotypha africana]